MGVDPVTSSLILGGLSTAGGLMKGSGEADISRDKNQMEKDKLAEGIRQFNLKNDQSMKSIASGKDLAGNAQSNFLNETAAAPEELQQYETALTNQQLPLQDQANSQVMSNLRANGVRGGEAATLQNRASGQMKTDLQTQLMNLKLQDAQKRRDARTGLFGQQSQQGTTASLATPGYY